MAWLVDEVHQQRLNAPRGFHREIAVDHGRGGEVLVSQKRP
jgi:hypothetical protein